MIQGPRLCTLVNYSDAQSVEVLFLQVQADLKIDSPGLCRALFEVYTGSNTVVPEAKKAWAEGARQLLDSEEIRRSTRRAGGGKDQ